MTRKVPTKKPTLNKLSAAIHRLIRVIVIDRDGGKCLVCGRDGSAATLQAGHVIAASSCVATRFDLGNIVCQCSSCNKEHRHHPHRLFQAYIDRFGLPAFNHLCDSATPGFKITRKHLEGLQEFYKLRAADIKGSTK